MIHLLSQSLTAMLNAAAAIPADTDISFDRPVDSYKPDKTTVNLFLYDVRENTELRRNEPVTERANGVVTIQRPPLRVACSYLVTAWIESGVLGEEAILRQHELLGEVLRVFSSLATIPASCLQGNLATQAYPIPLVLAQGELMRNPAEFWAALGGKLRPSITLTATVAMTPATEPIEARAVSTKEIHIRDAVLGVEAALFQFGGVVRDAATQGVIAGVDLSLQELGRRATTDADGRFRFFAVAAGTYHLHASKQGYTDGTLSTAVPGGTATAFDIKLSATP